MHASTSAATTTRIHDTEFEKFTSHQRPTLTMTPNTTDEVHFSPVLHNTTPSIHQLLITKALGRHQVRFRRLNEKADAPTPPQVLRTTHHVALRFRRQSDDVDFQPTTHDRYSLYMSHTTYNRSQYTNPLQIHRIPQKQHIP